MFIDITLLRSSIKKYIEIDEIYSFTKNKLKSTDIISLDNVKINGTISKNNLDEYIIDITIKGQMVLPCSLTLKPVNYPFETNINGNLSQIYEENGEKFENTQKTIDILPIIWENILMEIPIRVVSDDLQGIKTEGDGWELITGED